MNQLTGYLLVHSQVLLIVAWLAALIFPVSYAATTKFWRSEMGMHFFSYGMAVWLQLTPYVILIVFGDFPGRGLISFVLFHIVTFVIVWRAVIFLKVFFSTRNGKGNRSTPEHPKEGMK